MFSHLDIRFYSKLYDDLQGSLLADQINENLSLAELNAEINDGELNISADMLVSELETAFDKQFGLHVQVFKKSEDSCIQTSKTDHWTLKKQQETALSMDI